MEKKGSLFTRTGSVGLTLKKKKKRVGFLDLPAELRNQIYDYYFQQRFRCEFAGKRAQLGRPTQKVIKFCIEKSSGQLGLRGGSNSNTSSNKIIEGKAKDGTVEHTAITTARFSRILGRYSRRQWNRHFWLMNHSQVAMSISMAWAPAGELL